MSSQVAHKDTHATTQKHDIMPPDSERQAWHRDIQQLLPRVEIKLGKGILATQNVVIKLIQ